jgi:hypothetical protein
MIGRKPSGLAQALHRADGFGNRSICILGVRACLDTSADCFIFGGRRHSQSHIFPAPMHRKYRRFLAGKRCVADGASCGIYGGSPRDLKTEKAF